MEKYLGMNFDKYPIMLKKLVTTSSDSGRLDSLTAFIFVWVWTQPIFSELLCIKLNLFNSELALVRVKVVPRSDTLCTTVSRVLLCY